MKHLFASCAVIALMAAPALAQSTYEPTDPFAAPEVEAEEEVLNEETVLAYDAQPDAEAEAVVDPVAEVDMTAEEEMAAETQSSDDTEMVADVEPAAENDMVAETEVTAETEMVADVEAVEAPIDLAELPQEYSTADLNALMLAQLNDTAVEIAEMEFVVETEAFAQTETSTDTFADTTANAAPEGDLAMTESGTPEATATGDYAATTTESETSTYGETDTSVSTETETAMTESVTPEATVTEGYAATETGTATETYAETETYVAPGTETAMTETVTPEATATEDYAATATESESSTYAETDTSVSTETETTMTQDYAATETLPEDDATMADDTTVTPEVYASVDPNAQDNVAPPIDGTVDLSDETGATVMMSEQSNESALNAEGDIDQTAVEIASQDSRFTTLVELVGIAGLEDALNLEGPYTVFAPTNDAFAALPEETLARLKSEAGKAELTEILKAHVAEGTVLAGEVPLAGQAVETLADTSLNVTGSVDGSLNVEGSTTIGDGVSASNGVVYAIDAVILPEAAPEMPMVDTEG